MVAQRQPVDRVIDLVVGLPVATAVAARRSIPLIRQASRQGLHGVAQRARRSLGAGADPSGVPDAASESASATATAPSAGQVHDVGSVVEERNAGLDSEMATIMPIEDYDHLAARQVVDRLATLTSPELAQIELYERAHRHRQTVLGRIAQLQS